MTRENRSSRTQRSRMSRELNRTKKTKAVGDENTRARRIYLWLAGILTFLSGLSMFFIIFEIIEGNVWDPVATIFEGLVFLCLAIGMYGIFNAQPPLHLFVPLGAVVNLVFSLLIISAGDPTGMLQAAVSFVILYLAYRFPINLSQKRTVFRRR